MFPPAKGEIGWVWTIPGVRCVGTGRGPITGFIILQPRQIFLRHARLCLASGWAVGGTIDTRCIRVIVKPVYHAHIGCPEKPFSLPLLNGSRGHIQEYVSSTSIHIPGARRTRFCLCFNMGS